MEVTREQVERLVRAVRSSERDAIIRYLNRERNDFRSFQKKKLKYRSKAWRANEERQNGLHHAMWIVNQCYYADEQHNNKIARYIERLEQQDLNQLDGRGQMAVGRPRPEAWEPDGPGPIPVQGGIPGRDNHLRRLWQAAVEAARLDQGRQDVVEWRRLQQAFIRGPQAAERAGFGEHPLDDPDVEVMLDDEENDGM